MRLRTRNQSMETRAERIVIMPTTVWRWRENLQLFSAFWSFEQPQPGSSHEQRPLVLYPAVSLVSVNPEGSHNHPARDPRALASGGLSLLLALEVTPAGRATADRDRPPCTDPADEHGEPALGCAAYPRRASEARLRRRPVESLEVHGTEARSTIANMEDLPSQPR